MYISLATIKFEVISKVILPLKISRVTRYSVNDEFKSDLNKLSISGTTKRQSQQENKETHRRVQVDRRYLI